MNRSSTESQESTDSILIEEVKQIQAIALAEAIPTCQACGTRILPGETVIAYVYRSEEASLFNVGYCLCNTHKGEPSEYRCGKRELVVIGRVGTCLDHAVQASWPILLAPKIVAVSDVNSTESRTRISLGSTEEGHVEVVHQDEETSVKESTDQEMDHIPLSSEAESAEELEE